MAVPDYQSLMLPLLEFAAKKGGEISTSEAVETLAKELRLADDDLNIYIGVRPLILVF